nr:unnamed protein product [Callosobruchus chinensis]
MEYTLEDLILKKGSKEDERADGVCHFGTREELDDEGRHQDSDALQQVAQYMDGCSPNVDVGGVIGAGMAMLYLDFLDIMQKFKKQTIDIHDMLKQVSNLFKEVPELIVALSRFLPPGNKVEVQKNDQGYASQVSVSIPTSPTGTINSDPQSKEENEIPVYTINIFIQ